MEKEPESNVNFLFKKKMNNSNVIKTLKNNENKRLLPVNPSRSIKETMLPERSMKE